MSTGRAVLVALGLWLISAALTEAEPTRTTHVVSRGETLARVAARYGVTVDDIRTWNDLGQADVSAGRRLLIWTDLDRPGGPAAGDPGAPTPPRSRGDAPHPQKPVFDDPIAIDPSPPPAEAPVAGSVPPVSQPGAEDTHLVRAGDTLSEIAELHGIGLSTLRDLNDLAGNRIHVGQVLRVREPETASAPVSPPPEYVVQRGDTISEIADRFHIGVSLLRQINGLRSDTIVPGQRLTLRPTSSEEATHVVGRGQNLTVIARRYGVTVNALRELNGLRGSTIHVGQKLRVRATPRQSHVVERGDALWEIAAAYGVSVQDLKAWNTLTSDRIYPGQTLTVARNQAAPTLGRYTVRRGDSLGEIAQLHQMSLSELRSLNGLRGAVIHPGQVLDVRPIPGRRGGTPMITEKDVPWSALALQVPGLKQIGAENGPYYGAKPKAARQSGSRYLEESRIRPRPAYEQAQKLFTRFAGEVGKLGHLSDDLDGWHIVLDPGHGGNPGSITKVRDGRGDLVYVVEDEYVYDIALRMYVLLRLHGASVTLTVLSPNHLIRQTSPATQTFVHERNEVFNLAECNRSNHPSAWPRGGQRALDRRIQVARDAFKGVPESRRLFLSLHADNSPGAPAVPLVLYYSTSKRVDQASRRFGRALLPALGAGAQVRGQNLGVLRNNPASAKVLVEVRNVAHADHAWALRFEELRQRDAEKIVRGILDYARGR